MILRRLLCLAGAAAASAAADSTCLASGGACEDPELVSLGQLGRPAVLSTSRLKETLVELSDEALLIEDSGPQEFELPAAWVAPKAALPAASSAPPRQGAAPRAAGAAAEDSAAGHARVLLATLAFVLWARAGAALWARRAGAAERLVGSGEAPEDLDDPLDDGFPPLTADECMRYCRGRQPGPVRPKTAVDQWGRTPLHAAAGAADAPEVRRLLQCGEDADAVEACDETPLHLAARAGCAAACEALLAAGAHANAVSSSERTPLVEAALAGHQAVCQLLLERGGHAGGISDAELPPVLSALFVSRLIEGMPAVSTPPPEIVGTDVEEEDDDEAFAPQN